MENNLTPSTYGPQKNREITKEEFDRIKKELGVECLILITEDKANDCDGKGCLGHYTFFRSEGFNEHNVRGIGDTMMEHAEEIVKSNQLK